MDAQGSLRKEKNKLNEIESTQTTVHLSDIFYDFRLICRMHLVVKNYMLCRIFLMLGSFIFCEKYCLTHLLSSHLVYTSGIHPSTLIFGIYTKGSLDH